ncbi:FtsW/RodA/SpoVE family cell cycle protein [Alicyclobacillus cycloheptanicus]|uniref:Rod shape determining protein RodA n=1 Tax=Alicyclobacillus cycloheptanicus TaxID=1457 RepID=A0ABT9XFZ3_9BACL|nr:FtsW/RodA/SpoVE family cell cycle protein [Alicyclobacillus cycloheptanicus]MDQ0188989.1 rod shape determining protein RodA [Alicyclobacillus cycloheptanicus]WDM01668.1 FtsW/RodA/SpoVE family cell cycle protein [Alicyclobacillus cycloheptanicus]
METFRRNFRELDFTLIGAMILLAVYGCIALLATTYGKPTAPNGPVPPHVLSKQIMFEVVGFILMLAMAAVDYRVLRKYRWWIYGVVLLLLVAVFAMPTVNGAHSWIPLGSLTFEPSEFMKLALIIVIAGFMADNDESEFPDYRLRKTWPIWVVFIVPFALIYKEPALGQALVVFAIVMTMLVVYLKRSYFIIFTIITLLVVGGITLVAVQYPHQAVDFLNNVVIKHHIIRKFQLMRILTWLDPTLALNKEGYSVHQTQMAIGSGQIFGEGLFNGIETSGGWIPNQWTDYIFSGIGEEFGFVGSSLLILLFLVIFYRMTRIAGTSRDAFGTYLIIGLVGMFAFQVFENIGMDMYMSPATGIALPFVTYGGSSLLLNYMAIGLALSVCVRRKRLRFS